MAERTSSPSEESLADRLRREAMQSRPAFSERLHDRVCRAIERLKCEADAPESPRVRAARWKWIAAACAACLACAAIVLWRATMPTHGPEMANTGSSDAPNAIAESHLGAAIEIVSDLAERVSEPIGDWLDSTAAVPPWAHLDHDAQVTVDMLAEHLPFDVASSLAFSSREGQ